MFTKVPDHGVVGVVVVVIGVLLIVLLVNSVAVCLVVVVRSGLCRLGHASVRCSSFLWVRCFRARRRNWF